MAMTADGKIASANRAVSTFGSARDHAYLLALRATADAVMCGARTADLNAVNLGPGPANYRRARLQRGLSEYNLRVIISGSGTLDPDAEVFQHRFSPVIVLTTARASSLNRTRLRAVATEVKVCGQNEINFPAALRWLRKKWGVKRLLVEGGGELNATLFRDGLVDELNLTLCPKIFGGRSAPTIAGGLGALKLSDSTLLTLKSARRVGDELFLLYAILPRAR